MACTSTHSRCETLCDSINRCSGATVDCSDSKLDKCVDKYNDLGDSCQDSFNELADCLDDHNACDEAAKECVGETTEFVAKCQGQILF